MNVKNNIIKPILFTFLAMLLLLVAVFSIMHFFFPLNVSNWFYGMGANKAATYYMERSYEQTKDYNQLYSLINLSVKTEDWERVEKYYEIFSKDEDYLTFTLKIDASNLTQNVSNLVKSTLYSEDNYLKNKYVLALVKQDKIEKAYEYAANNSNLQVSSDDLGIYIFTNIISEGVNFNRITYFERFGPELEDYFLENINVFNSVTNQAQPQKVAGLVLGSRINEIANDLKVIKNYNSNLITLTNEEINNLVLTVSQVMPELV